MVIALLLALGVPLIIVVAIAVVLVRRKRWLKRQPDVFVGAIRVSSGDVVDLKPKWKRGSGRWVHDVLVWYKAPLTFSALVPVDGLSGERETKPDEVKRLGDHPVAVEFASNGAKIEVATKVEHHALVTGPFTAVSAPPPRTSAQAENSSRQAAVRGL
jgi:hypothetical protein